VGEALIRGYKAALIGRSSYIDVNGHKAQVQVAAKGAWQISDVDRYTAGTIDQIVLVNVTGDQREFYICPGNALRDEVRKRYDEFLRSNDGVRPRNPDAKHAAIYPQHVLKWRDDWSQFA